MKKKVEFLNISLSGATILFSSTNSFTISRKLTFNSYTALHLLSTSMFYRFYAWYDLSKASIKVYKKKERDESDQGTKEGGRGTGKRKGKEE